MRLFGEKLENQLGGRFRMLKSKIEKRGKWEKKRARIKNRLLKGSKPRLVVFRSNKNIFAQIVDDIKSKTLVSASSLDKSLQDSLKKTNGKIEKSSVVGKSIATLAKKNKIKEVIFDRNGYSYHGRIKALADGARKAGLTF